MADFKISLTDKSMTTAEQFVTSIQKQLDEAGKANVTMASGSAPTQGEKFNVVGFHIGQVEIPATKEGETPTNLGIWMADLSTGGQVAAKALKIPVSNVQKMAEWCAENKKWIAGNAGVDRFETLTATDEAVAGRDYRKKHFQFRDGKDGRTLVS